MRSEMRLLGKSFATNFTTIRFVSRMNAHMSINIPSIRDYNAAEIAFE